ncbi:hypothetical protein [Staphylococcus xylosus]|uniref:hypothetical protein n=1 Tax=Staphylococcus xylosus TaxID=1288 RepID=UPI00164D0491|nr:hypothetical protein [Staphylococcus xylosus]
MIEREGGTLFKKSFKKIKLYSLQAVQGYSWLNKFIKTNILPNRLVWFLIFSTALVLAFGLGQHHKNKEEYIKAMTVSDTDQALSFSKTGTKFNLQQQKRNKDMTIVPFKLGDSEKQSTDASDYKVVLMPVMKKQLPSNVKSSIVFFGNSGEGAIAIKGDLPKEPLVVIVTNNSNFSTSNEGNGTLNIEGKETEVNYNGVGFTINPKANNVKKDKTIDTDMSMSDLYYTTFAKKQLADIRENYEKSQNAEEKLKNKEAAIVKDIKKANKALKKDENDMNYDNSVDTDGGDSTSSISSMDETLENTDTSNTDIQNKRNDSIDDLENIQSDIKTENDTQDGLQLQAKQVQDYTKTKIFDLLTINSKTELRTNEDPKK